MASAETLPVLPLGSQGLKASKQGLGCMGMSAFYTAGKQADEESLAVFDRALELGVTLLDTAEVYGPHTNEELVGKAIKGRRDKFVVCTKFGILVENGKMKLDSSPQNIRRAVEGSLSRLDIDCIDLYYQHRVDPNTPLEDTFGELKKLVSEGKVRHVGISEASADQIRLAHSICPLTAVQLEWSLFSRDVEAEIVPTCRELGIGIVAYSPLGRGFLTGQLRSREDLPPDDWRRSNPRFSEENFHKNLELVEHVERMAKRKGCTPGQIALAWVHAQGDDVFPIPGTKRVSRLEENVVAARLALTAEEVKELGEAIDVQKVAGTRY